MRLLPIIVWVAVAVVLFLPLVRRALAKVPRPPRSLPDELVKDPVCQTYVVKSRAIRRADAGQIRYFCSEECARLDAGR